jgi:D-alanyl-D-alanine carboxypeptidase
MRIRSRHRAGKAAVSALSLSCLALVLTIVPIATPPAGASSRAALNRTMRQLLATHDGPIGVIAVIDRNGRIGVHSMGTSQLGQSTPMTADDHLRLASVSKAFSGAVALSLVAKGTLHLSDTVGKWLPTLPSEWSKVTLAELLQHTSGIDDFSQSDDFLTAVKANLTNPPPPATLLNYADPELTFTPGTKYEYSNSDNIIVALMVQAATGQSYENELATQVYGPLGLTNTSLPSGVAMPTPIGFGYQPDPPNQPEDVTELIAAGWSWASGGIVSTPLDSTAFVRAYARGATTNQATHAIQMSTFRPGSSEPPGPGTNSAGLAIFRYQTECGTVYGHTGNTVGYTQFIASTADGTDSVTVSVNAQISPKTNPVAFAVLQKVELAGVCTALGD